MSIESDEIRDSRCYYLSPQFSSSVVTIEEFFSWRTTLSMAPVFTKKHLNTSRMMHLFFATQETKSTVMIRDVSVGNHAKIINQFAVINNRRICFWIKWEGFSLTEKPKKPLRSFNYFLILDPFFKEDAYIIFQKYWLCAFKFTLWNVSKYGVFSGIWTLFTQWFFERLLEIINTI